MPILALLVLSLVTYMSVQTFSHDEDRLNHVYHVQSASAEYMRLVVDLETGFRGFVLTKQPQFLQPYLAAQKRVLAVGLSLKQMVINNPDQHLLIENAQTLVQQLMKDKDRLIERVKAGHPEDALDYIETEKGRALMLGVREEMARFDSREVELLRLALASSSEDRSVLLGVVVGGGGLALVLMILPLQLIARSITGPLASLAKNVGSTSAGTVPEVVVLPRRDEIGDLTRVMHAMSTQIQTHLDHVRQSEAKYRGIVDYAPIGIFTSQGNRIIFSNRQNWILAGRNPDAQLDPEELWDTIHPEDRNEVRSAFSLATLQEVEFEKVFRFLHPTGVEKKILSRAVPINKEEGELAVYQGFNVDITALELMRAQLSRAEKLATLGQVAAGIAHEIRNPLVGIGSTTSLLMEDFSEHDPRRRDLTTVLQETKRLDRIVNQIVDYARPRGLVPVSFDIEEIIRETVDLLSELLKEKQIVVQWSEPQPSHRIQADRDQMKQVILNTIQNAIEAMTIGGKLHMRVQPSTRQEEQGLILEIKDNGRGIGPSDLPRVFEPFFTTGKRRGTGLGLAICRNIIDAHGGEIQVQSQPGSGTNISIWLPVAQHSQLQPV